MFEDSPTFSKYNAGRGRVIGVHLGHVPYIEPESADDRKPMRRAIVLAVLAHALFFVLQIPAGRELPQRIGQQRPVYAVKQVRFQPPPPRVEQQVPERREKRRIVPIPDPTPEEPEPIRVAEIEIPDADVVTEGDVVFGIPEGPPGPYRSAPAAMRLDGSITPPVKVFAPQPLYTEEGRQNRTQGVVILETIVDAEGNVDSVKVLKGLPDGLSDTAVEAARSWKYKPALRDGEPVAVFVNLTIRFSLQ